MHDRQTLIGRPPTAGLRRRRASRRTHAVALASTAVVALTCSVAPASAADGARVVRELTTAGVVTDATNPGNRLGPRADGIVMVVTPGTDDGTLDDRIKRTVGQRTTLIVAYPESLWPFVGGKSSPVPPLADTYDASKHVAVDRNLTVMRRLGKTGTHVVYTGYSQGADALGNATEKALAQGIDLDDAKIVLVADTRSPWGIKVVANTIAGVPEVVRAFGITPDGARDPARSSGADVTSAIIVGDPASDFQWQPRRPLESILVNGAGFLAIHTGWGAQTYGNLDALGTPTELRSVDGTTRYRVYDARHPLALLRQMVHDRTGLPYTRADLKRWDAEGERFFATEVPSVDNSAVPVAEVRMNETSVSGPAPKQVAAEQKTGREQKTGGVAAAPPADADSGSTSGATKQPRTATVRGPRLPTDPGQMFRSVTITAENLLPRGILPRAGR